MPANSGLDQAAKSLSDIYRHAGKTASSTEEQQIVISRRFLKWLAMPLVDQMGISQTTETPLTMLDLACGSGVVTQEVQDILPGKVLGKSRFMAGDSSEALIELVRKRIAVEGWVNTEAQGLDAMEVGLPDNSFSHVSIALGLHLIPQPDKVLQCCKRILKPDGILGITTPCNDPTHSMWQSDIRSAFASFPFDAPFPANFPSQMHDQGHWADPDWVEKYFREQGFKDVEVRIYRDVYRVDSVDDFFMAFGGMLAWVMNGWWSVETRNAHSLEEVKELTRRYLEDKYGGKEWDIYWSVVCATGRVDK